MAWEDALVDRLLIFLSMICRAFYNGGISLRLSFLKPSWLSFLIAMTLNITIEIKS